jgi:hypothetical protein
MGELYMGLFHVLLVFERIRPDQILHVNHVTGLVNVHDHLDLTFWYGL